MEFKIDSLVFVSKMLIYFFIIKLLFFRHLYDSFRDQPISHLNHRLFEVSILDSENGRATVIKVADNLIGILLCVFLSARPAQFRVLLNDGTSIVMEAR